MGTTNGKYLKTQNVGWIWSVVALDVFLLPLLKAGVDTGSAEHLGQWLVTRGALATASPVISLLLTSILPSDWKAALVYWRFRDVLPSHRAFTVHAQDDPRIDLKSLRRNVGNFPTEARDQSSQWYKLYKAVELDVIVATPHRHFLLFRDLAALSFVLAIALPNVLLITDRLLSLPAFFLFVAQYFVSAVAARHLGTRMVTNVLALHSTKKR